MNPWWLHQKDGHPLSAGYNPHPRGQTPRGLDRPFHAHRFRHLNPPVRSKMKLRPIATRQAGYRWHRHGVIAPPIPASRNGIHSAEIIPRRWLTELSRLLAVGCQGGCWRS
jgi:hypothetical protein